MRKKKIVQQNGIRYKGGDLDKGVKIEIWKRQWNLQNSNTTSCSMYMYFLVYLFNFLVGVGAGEVARERLNDSQPHIRKKFKN